MKPRKTTINALRRLHRQLQRERVRIEVGNPKTAELLLDAEFHCLEAANVLATLRRNAGKGQHGH